MSQHVIVNGDHAVLDGDEAVFDQQFGHRRVNVSGPATMHASGQALNNGRRVCVLGDEKRLSVQAGYRVEGLSNPGTGIVTILLLTPAHQAACCRSSAPVLLKGAKFTALFTPMTAASDTSSRTSDPLTPTPGQGQFKLT